MGDGESLASGNGNPQQTQLEEIQLRLARSAAREMSLLHVLEPFAKGQPTEYDWRRAKSTWDCFAKLAEASLSDAHILMELE